MRLDDRYKTLRFSCRDHPRRICLSPCFTTPTTRYLLRDNILNRDTHHVLQRTPYHQRTFRDHRRNARDTCDGVHDRKKFCRLSHICLLFANIVVRAPSPGENRRGTTRTVRSTLGNENRRQCPHRISMEHCIDTFHKNVILPIRATFIRRNLCYICHTFDSSGTRTFFLKNASRARLLAYVSCSKCESIIPSLLELYEHTGMYVPNSIYDGIDLSRISFLRQNAIENSASIKLSSYVPITKYKNRVYSGVSWNGLQKKIPLCNLIFYNRDIYGWSISQGPLVNASRFWTKLLHREYLKANQFGTLSLHNRVDALVEKIIYLFWRGELL